MNPGWRTNRLLPIALGLALPVAFGAPPAVQSEPGTNVPGATPVQPPASGQYPPVPPPVKSRVDLFRELLAMPEPARRVALTNKPPQIREQILEKVREYEALSRNEQELRLRVTELYSYLWPLMNIPGTNRVADLARIPEDYRGMVAERLKQWDQLAPEVQNDVLKNQAAMLYFTEIGGASEEQQKRIRDSLTPARREHLERGMAQWGALAEEQQQRALRNFNRIFTLNDQEKERVFSTLSAAERRKIESAVQSFAGFSPSERARCLGALNKFSKLSVEKRQEFLQNAERWKTMSPDQREAWTQLISKLASQPPMPVPPPPMPQLPRTRILATNADSR